MNGLSFLKHQNGCEQLNGVIAPQQKGQQCGQCRLLPVGCRQDGDHTARFAAVIASCAANEGAGVATTMPRNLRELSDTNEAWSKGIGEARHFFIFLARYRKILFWQLARTLTC